jgi:predicted secreted protein
MNWFVGTATYIVIWWITIFAVLPWGVRPANEADQGHDAGAPANPRLLMKAGITTVVAAVIWVFIYWAVNSGLISLSS